MSIISWRTSQTSHSNMMCNKCCRLFYSYVSVPRNGEICPFCGSKNTVVTKVER